MQISCNFINVSLASFKKFQLRKCFQILGTEKFTSSSHNILCSESTKLNIYEFGDIISAICRIDINENIEVIQKAEVNNTIYCSGYFLYLEYHEFDTCLGKIVSMFLFDDVRHFLLKLWKGNMDSHVCSYVIDKMGHDLNIKNEMELSYHVPLTSLKSYDPCRTDIQYLSMLHVNDVQTPDV